MRLHFSPSFLQMSVMPLLRLELDVQLLQRAQEQVWVVLEVVLARREPHLVDPLHQGLEAVVQLATRERRPQAVVNARPEREVRHRVLAVQVDIRGALEAALIAVGGGVTRAD